MGKTKVSIPLAWIAGGDIPAGTPKKGPKVKGSFGSSGWRGVAYGEGAKGSKRAKSMGQVPLNKWSKEELGKGKGKGGKQKRHPAGSPKGGQFR